MSNAILSSYRLGDLVILSNLTENEKEKIMFRTSKVIWK